jgi:hypothetical protein
MANVVTEVVEFRIDDNMGDDEESNEVNFQVGRFDDRAFVSVATLDDSCSWMMTQEQWEQFKFQVERVFNNQARSK